MRRLLRVCLDTNIWISGILFSGAPSVIVELALKKKFHLITSSFILEELRKNLVKKFNVEKKAVEKLIDSIVIIADLFEPTGRIEVVQRNMADNFVLETATLGKSDYLVTGDKRDLLPLQKVEGVRIVSSNSFLDELRK